MLTGADGQKVERAVVALLALLPLVSTLVATGHGVGLAYDSINYLSAAVNFSDGRGLVTATLEPLTIAPPGYPVLLGALDRTGIDVETAARYSGAIGAVVAVLLSYLLTLNLVRSTAVRLVVVGVVAVSPALLFVSTLALTECLFIVVLLSFSIVLSNVAREHGASRRSLVLMVSAVWVGFSLRYTGLFMVPAGALVIAVAMRERFGSALRTVALFSTAGLSLPVAWLVRNRLADGTFMGERGASIEDWAGVRDGLVGTVVGWSAPQASVIAVVSAAIGVLVAVVTRTRVSTTGTAQLSPLYPTAVITGLFVVHLVFSELTTNIDPIDGRLLAPVFVPLVVLVAVAGARVHTRIGSPTALRLVAFGVAGVVLSSSSVQLIDDVEEASSDGIYLRAASVQQDPQTLAVADLDPRTAVFSNQRMNIWAVLRRQPVDDSPRHRIHNSSTPVDDLPRFERRIECEPAVLVWYGPDSPTLFMSPSQLGAHVRLDVIEAFATGTNYRVSSQDGQRSNCSQVARTGLANSTPVGDVKPNGA